MKILRGAPTAATQSGDAPANAGTTHYAWDTERMEIQIESVVGSGFYLKVKVGGDADSPAAVDDFDYIVHHLGSLTITPRTKKLSIYFEGAGTYTYKTTFSVVGWPEAGPPRRL